MESMDKAVNSRFSKFEYLLTIGDFNAQASHSLVIFIEKDFCDIYSFKYLLKNQYVMKILLTQHA